MISKAFLSAHFQSLAFSHIYKSAAVITIQHKIAQPQLFCKKNQEIHDFCMERNKTVAQIYKWYRFFSPKYTDKTTEIVTRESHTTNH